MLVSQLGDLTSSAEHRIKKTIAGGTATTTAPAIVHMPQAALNLQKAGASLALRSKLLTGLKPLKSPLAPSSLVANALRDVKLNLTPATSAPATTAAAAAAATPPPVTPTPALATTTSALTATPSGGGGGGGGGGDDLAPADDTSAVPAPTGWAALSTSTKVIIVAGVAGVAFIGYKALRRR